MITIHIERRTLQDLQACEDGMELFESLCLAQGRKHSVQFRWTPLHMVWMAVKHPGLWTWCRDRGLLPQLSLTGADLYGADLRGADLYGADLRGADLHGAYLRGADLCGADLRGADLYGADLRGADLHGAYLCGADLYGADLYRADLRGADLHGADLCGATADAAPAGWRLQNGILVRE